MVSGRTRLLYLLFGSIPLGSFATIPPGVVGGLTVTPAPAVALLIVLRYLVGPGGLASFLNSAFSMQRLLLLALFWLVSVTTTLVMPRFFEGIVPVVPLAGGTIDYLRPTVQNFSQIAYLSVSVFLVFAFARLFQDEEQRDAAILALIIGASVTIITGFLDFMTRYLPIEPFIDALRTANYQLLTNVEVLGSKRVVGLMPEASAYGGICLTFLSMLYFFRHCAGSQRPLIAVLMPALAVFAWLSASSATYVALACLAVMAAIEWLWTAGALMRLTRRYRRPDREMLLALGVITLGGAIAFTQPRLVESLWTKVDTLIFKKDQSDSYRQRSQWTQASWDAMLATYGLGVGVGSTRASNTVVSVVSSTGIIGGLLYYGFLLQCYWRRASSLDARRQLFLSAAKWSYPPIFLLGTLAGTTPDFGAVGAFEYGLMCAVSIAGRRTKL